MSLLLLKSLISVFMLLLSCLAMFTMFEVFGRNEKRYNIEGLKKFHKANGIVYLLVFVFISYFCLKFIMLSGSELTPRATFHAVFAITIIVLLGLKMAFIHFYRQFYGAVKTIGILIALITFGLVGTSGGYYLLVSKFGSGKAFDRFMEQKMKGQMQASSNSSGSKFIIRTDTESIEKGKRLYESECSVCHNPHSTEWYFGPGHKGILKNPFFPVSKKPSTPDNIADQLRNPFRDMPSFPNLSDEDILNLIAYMNTL
ncbi:hypothetical protein JZK55_05040 [Dissulfurispira thermophila]|uniref:Cytochrome c domain-containing protein n=2 Tax=root TaxID=1 RepID=A0A7G1GZV4_9BACT|nr:cytochrome c [Dissulfurispira thermophila]BCB95582.1 hypothetical protein JZK55_05040 [Dissulfurispira thermophila]